jgi:putative YphP/YqiW family bacilliredoxin
MKEIGGRTLTELWESGLERDQERHRSIHFTNLGLANLALAVRMLAFKPYGVVSARRNEDPTLCITTKRRNCLAMRYPEEFIGPMRQELTRLGVKETRTSQEVDATLGPDSGTVMMVVNSMCGCAAGRARPGIALSLKHSVLPDKVATVFAGGDIEATARVREYLKDYPPSSPSVALFRDGKPVFMLHRHQIENRDAMDIAKSLTQAFDAFCVKQPR